VYQINPRILYPTLWRTGLLFQDFIAGSALGFGVFIILVQKQSAPQANARDSNVQVFCGQSLGVDLERVPKRFFRFGLLDELKAINLWDRDYLLRANPDSVETDSWKARRLRLVELRQELLMIIEAGKTSQSESQQIEP